MATLYSDTVSNVLQIISDLRAETSTNTDAARIRAISRQERGLAKRFKQRLFHLKDQSMAGSGVNSYTIGSSSFPYESKGLSELFVGGTAEENRVTVLDFQAYKEQYNRDNSQKLAYEWYDATNDAWKIYVNPAPSASQTIYYSYYWTPPKRSATSDTVVTFDTEALARLALADIYESEDEDDKAVDQRNLAEQMIAEAMGDENAPAIGQLYTVQAIENMGRNRGYGTY